MEENKSKTKHCTDLIVHDVCIFYNLYKYVLM